MRNLLNRREKCNGCDLFMKNESRGWRIARGARWCARALPANVRCDVVRTAWGDTWGNTFRKQDRRRGWSHVHLYLNSKHCERSNVRNEIPELVRHMRHTLLRAHALERNRIHAVYPSGKGKTNVVWDSTKLRQRPVIFFLFANFLYTQTSFMSELFVMLTSIQHSHPTKFLKSYHWQR